MHYYQFNIADYRKDTMHLSRLEHGIYRDLIDWYYLDESPIPLETQVVMRRLRLETEAEAQALNNVLSDFFTKADGWRHHRIDQDILDYHSMVEKNQANGKLGGRPKKTQSVLSGLPDETQVKANQEPITNNQLKTLVVSELTPCPHLEIIDLYASILPELPQVRKWEGTRAKHLKARWSWVLKDLENKGKPFDKSAGLDFFRRMFGYIAKSDFLMGRSGSFSCSLPWIVQDENFTKIIEGNYENKVAA